jgi:hypothetical protein
MKTTLFFDIDGVLSSYEEVTSGIYNHYLSSKNTLGLRFYPLKKACVDAFQGLLEKFDIDVVMSSSWRFAPFQNYMDILTVNGAVPSRWKKPLKTLPVTPIHIKDRWDAIRTYTRNHECRPVIIDDLDLPQRFSENFLDNHDGFFIQTWEPKGISDPVSLAEVTRILTHCVARTEGVY